jgi:hypothetical protein
MLCLPLLQVACACLAQLSAADASMAQHLAEFRRHSAAQQPASWQTCEQQAAAAAAQPLLL